VRYCGISKTEKLFLPINIGFLDLRVEEKQLTHITHFVVIEYCGVAPKSHSIERPLLVNGYASRNGFIGNSSFPTQRENSYQSYTFLHTTINALNQQRTYNMQPLNEGFSIRSDCAIHQRASEQRHSSDPVWRRDRIPPP
jgi:hypothetical protein